MNTSGNAESLYYLKDESNLFVGAIKTVCSSIDFIFEDNDLKDIKYYKDPVSNMSSMKKELVSPQRLKGFKWMIDQKPLDKKVDLIPLPKAIHIENKTTIVEENEDLEKTKPDKKEKSE